VPAATATNQFHANATACSLLFKNPEVLFLTLSFQANVLFDWKCRVRNVNQLVEITPKTPWGYMVK
jgi:hypothetical protein